ncbi:MAG: hypothetical protein GY705_18335 [Bacteroidetes bacterium]|nr:hypothetical protein [Bacteroidota bacterium]
MKKYLTIYILAVIFTYPICVYCDEGYSYLENILKKVENNLEKIGYDISKIKTQPSELNFSIIKPDCTMIYPYSFELYQQKDFDGKYYIRQIVNRAMSSGGKFSRYQYRWQNKFEPEIKTKLVVAKYIKEQDLIITASEYVDFFDPTQNHRNQADKLLGHYFALVNRNGVDHTETVEVYKLLLNYIESLPSNLKKVSPNR